MTSRRTPARRRAARTRPRRTWPRTICVLVLMALATAAGGFAYAYTRLSTEMDARLAANRLQPRLQVFARPVRLWEGQAMSRSELVASLNVLGYSERPGRDAPGAFAVDPDGALTVVARGGPHAGRHLRIDFTRATPQPRIRRLEIVDGERLTRLELDAPLLTSLEAASREKRRVTSLENLPPTLVEAVLAIEDRRFFEHAGVDPVRMVGALVTNLRGERRYLVGGSTLTQQLVKNMVLSPEKTLQRKLMEQVLAVRLEQRLTKHDILELYLNEVYLGHRGSFAVHGVAEGARLFFGRDVANLSLAQAATIAGVIQAPQTYSPFRHPERARLRRNVVLATMAEADYLPDDLAARAADEPLEVVSYALEDEAPYFVDFVGQVLANRHPELLRASDPVDVHTTLDLHLQRQAQRAVREGLERIDDGERSAQAALIATNPRTGELLALVGGRSYRTSQFNRATHARRQPGSVFKPFVYLAGLERAFLERRSDFTPASIVNDAPTVFATDTGTWRPDNYGDRYDGPITLRRALARSRNVPAVKVAEMAGYDRLAGLWQRAGGSPIDPYPSIALGAFETTPMEMASAFGLLATNGVRQPLRAIASIQVGEAALESLAPAPERIARPDLTYLVTNMLRSVFRDGTGAAARDSGFWLDAAGKSGTTNELRDAWFVGFTPELLTVVWVGRDDNQPLGLSGSQAALPIWTAFMDGALAGLRTGAFEIPPGIEFARVDPETGGLARPGCPGVITEAFLAGTVPDLYCRRHR